jgi:glycosyltransferase involved in cell wall biosynthesis
MKILIDVLGAPRKSGGMRLYAQELIPAWAEQFPDDHITVVGGDWVVAEFQRWASVDTITLPYESVVTRILGQFAFVPYVYALKRADFLLSVSPIVSPLVCRSRRMCVVHDWRHLKNRNEFGILQRSYRKLWQASVNRAGVAVAISGKTAQETRLFTSRKNIAVVENGRDHARRWPVVGRQPGQSLIVTFGYHSNKRPDLVIQAFGMLKSAVPKDTRLVVLGTRGEYAHELKQIALDEGVEHQCEFPGFLEAIQYQMMIQRSSVIVLASSDEGFGLPVAEAQYFGIPLVCTSDSGLDTIHGSGLLVADPTPASVAERIWEGFRTGLGSSNERASMNTWANVVRQIRSLGLTSVSQNFRSRAVSGEST